MRRPKATGGRPHSHPSAPWIDVMPGALESTVDGASVRAAEGTLSPIPANVVHSALATPDEDVIFLTAEDMSHGIAGTAVDASTATPLAAAGFAPQR